jgi:hypothetical protein
MKSLRFIFLAVCSLSFLTLTSCESFWTPKPSEESIVKIVQHPLYPLKVGNFWHYATIFYFPLVNEIDTLYSPRYRFTISRDTVITYQQIQYKCVVFGHNPYLFFSSTASESFYFQSLDLPDTLLRNSDLRLPLRLNDTLIAISGTLIASRTNPVIRRDTIYSICIGVDEEFQTLAGTFRCYVLRRIDSRRPDSIYHIYYAMGIGKVGEIIYKVDGMGKEQLYLKDILLGRVYKF